VEVVQVKFDPAISSFLEILEVFFATHDPTSLDRQGDDVGVQYGPSFSIMATCSAMRQSKPFAS